MTKEKTARLIPNAIQLCTDNEKVTLALNWSALYSLISLFSKIILFCSAALFYLIWCSGPDLHDDVPALAERSPGQGWPHPP